MVHFGDAGVAATVAIIVTHIARCLGGYAMRVGFCAVCFGLVFDLYPLGSQKVITCLLLGFLFY